MTEQKRKEAEKAVRASLSDRAGEEAFDLLLNELQARDQALACLRKAVKGVLPSLDDAFRRYGCAGKNCGTWRCPVGYPCQAWVIRRSAKDLRECLGDEGGAE